MFGFLMGTLQKFKAAEETAKTSDKVSMAVYEYIEKGPLNKRLLNL